MIDELVDTVGPLVQKNSNTLTVRCGDDVGTMHADLMKTRQILLNLLSNAGKFTRDGAITLEVAAPSASTDDRRVVFTVDRYRRRHDAASRPRRFSMPFTQADVTTTRKYGGTGLGLAIVSRFCQLMGGDGVGREPPRRGIALHRASAARRDRDAGRSDRARRRRVIERALTNDGDDPGGRRQRAEPRRAGAPARAARLSSRCWRSTASRRCRVARAAKPDLILMDLGLPGIDGWEATRQLKADAATRHIPIIVLSAHAMTNDRDMALAAGGDDFDTKPVRFQQLLEKIESLLTKAVIR